MKTIQIAAVMLAVFSQSACVVAPQQDQLLSNPFEVITFAGFTYNPGATVKLEALNQDDGNFEEFATATSGTFALTFGSRTLYYWWTTAAIADSGTPLTLCRWHESCSRQRGDVSATVRARELYPDSTLRPLFTHKIFGPACVYHKIDDGVVDDLFIAYWLCKPNIFNVITLRVLT